MGLGGQTVQLLQQPGYQDVTTGLTKALTQKADRQDAKMARYAQGLKDYAPIAERQTISAALDPTKQALDEQTYNKINAQYARTELDEKYTQGLSALDKEYADIQSKEITKYDAQGNPVISSTNQAFFEKQAKFEEEYKDYTAALDTKLAFANETTKATLNAGYNATNFEKEYTKQLVDSGIGLEKALSVSKAAAAQYTPAALTEAQKASQTAAYDTQKELFKNEMEFANQAYKGNQVITQLAKSGINGVGSTTNGKNRYGAKTPSYETITKSKAQLMSEIDDLGWGYWEDNKEVVKNYLDPLYKEFAGTMSPQEINDAILSFKDDGFIKDTLGPDASPEKVREVLLKQLAQKKAASGAGAGQANYVVSGRAGIKAEDRRGLIDAALARNTNANARISQQFASKGDRSTGLSALNQAITGYNAVTPGGTPPAGGADTGSTTAPKQLSTKDAVKTYGTDLKTLQDAIKTKKVSAKNPDIASRLQELLDASTKKKTAPTAAESKAQAAADAKKRNNTQKPFTNALGERVDPNAGNTGQDVVDAVSEKVTGVKKTISDTLNDANAKIRDYVHEKSGVEYPADRLAKALANTPAKQKERKAKQIVSITTSKMPVEQKRKTLRALGVPTAEIQKLLAQ